MHGCRREVGAGFGLHNMVVRECAMRVVVFLAHAEYRDFGFVLVERLDALFEQDGVVGVVGIGEPQVASACLRHPRVARGRKSLVFAVVHDGDARIRACEALGDGGALVGRGIVDDDQLPILQGLLLHAFDCVRYVRFDAVCRHHDADGG